MAGEGDAKSYSRQESDIPEPLGLGLVEDAVTKQCEKRQKFR